MWNFSLHTYIDFCEYTGIKIKCMRHNTPIQSLQLWSVYIYSLLSNEHIKYPELSLTTVFYILYFSYLQEYKTKQ